MASLLKVSRKEIITILGFSCVAAAVALVSACIAYAEHEIETMTFDLKQAELDYQTTQTKGGIKNVKKIG